MDKSDGHRMERLSLQPERTSRRSVYSVTQDWMTDRSHMDPDDTFKVDFIDLD